MFPFVPSNSLLYVTAADRGSIRPGDVVCYPGARSVIAHRVIRIEGGSTDRVFVTRGDAAIGDERVPEHAVGYVVTRVEHGCFAYDLDGWFGRVAASIALRRGLSLRVVAGAASFAVAVRARVRRSFGGAEPEPPPFAAGEARLSETLMPPPRAAASSESPDSLLRLLNHELRTPLNGILGFIEILLGELDGPLIVDERENLGFVRDAGRQLLALVSEVLDLVAAVASERDALFEPVDLADELERQRATLEERRGVKPVYVRADAPSDALVIVDRAELSRVLEVFGDLALTATQAGQVSFEAVPDGDFVRVTVRADGALFPPPPQRGERPSTPAERDGRLRRLRFEMAQRLCERVLGHLDVKAHSAPSELTLRLPRDGSGKEPVPAARGDIPLAVRYLAATGHDLRTPLNAILGFSDLVAMQPHESWTEAQHRSLSIVRERARDLATMVDDMIDWAKLELGDLRLNQRTHDARELIDRAVKLAVERSGGRGLQVEVSVQPGVGQLCVDGDRFVQAVVGLMDHAVRATPGPTLKLRAYRKDPAGTEQASMRLELVDPELTIRDQDQPHIFAAFRPSFAPTGQRVAGLHLGTAVARAVIRAHGGDVWFESRPNHGTTFVASLPVSCLA
jgi:signal transduction histidine kinase